jgi:hypothetical protein
LRCASSSIITPTTSANVSSTSSERILSAIGSVVAEVIQLTCFRQFEVSTTGFHESAMMQQWQEKSIS